MILLLLLGLFGEYFGIESTARLVGSPRRRLPAQLRQAGVNPGAPLPF